MKKLFFQIILPVFAIAGILGFITLFNPIQKQYASCSGHPTGPGGNWCENDQQYPFDGGAITVNINPQQNSCSNTTTSFSPSMTITGGGTNPGAYTIHWGWLNNFCTLSGQCDGSNSSDVTSLKTDTLNGNSSVTATANTLAPTGQFAGQACGDYQADFGFYVTRNIDNHNVGGINLGNLNNVNNNATWCNTGNTCNPPTITPTTSPTITPTEDCDGDFDNSNPSTDVNCAAPTATPTPGPSICPQLLCAYHAGCEWVGRTQCSCGQLVCQPTATPTVTPTTDCDGDFDGSNPATDQQCAPTATPTNAPTATPTQPTNGGNNNCTDNSCNNTNINNNYNNNSNSNSQSQSQNQNNNQTVDITLGNGQQQQQQQVLGSTTAPTQLPSTGANADVLFGLLGLIPVGWKIRKLI